MKIEQYTCDVCGTKRGETNHWWVIVPPVDLTGIEILPFVDAHNAPDAKHLCGQACALKAVSEFLGAAIAPEGEACN